MEVDSIAKNESPTKKLKTLSTMSLVTLLFWTLTLIGLLFLAISHEKQHVLTSAKLEARANFNKDVALRNWASKRGGVYVQVSKDTPPNPYLQHIADRDILTASKKQLTLMNPAYMLRQTMNEFSELYGIKGRITSLKPSNPINTPDTWETDVLKQFEHGLKEFSEFTTIDGKPYLRYMRAFITKEGCLKCHQHQGYQVGDVRGGVGVSVPLEFYINMKKNTVRMFMYSYSVLWLIGLIGIFSVNRFAKHQILRQHRTEAELLIKTKEQRKQSKNLERVNRILSQQAMYDGLTLVHNRRAFDIRIQEEWQRWRRSGTVFSVLITDLDFFKKYNDTYGHLTGDTCLKTVAGELERTAARRNDFTARYGGEEFVLVLPDTEIDQAMTMAERVRSAVEKLAVPHSSSDCSDVVTLSVGAASSAQLDKADDQNVLLALADKALYAAKNTGRNRVARNFS